MKWGHAQLQQTCPLAASQVAQLASGLVGEGEGVRGRQREAERGREGGREGENVLR